MLSAPKEYKEDFLNMFSYLFYTDNPTFTGQHADFYFRDGVLSVTKDSEDFKHCGFPSGNFRLPVLCTQTSHGSKGKTTSNSQRQSVGIRSGLNLYIGTRDQKSFRFLGIPYADSPARFSHARPFPGHFRTIDATSYGPSCSQVGGGREDCLYLNIQTPSIPRKDSTVGLRPVLFYIHGGGFTSGSGSDPLTDGGNFASREDIVVVTFNYRLSTLGFLFVPGTDIRGNCGIADQILALQWTAKNIAQFGGDPKRFTIMGEGSARVLLSSPAVKGLFQGVVEISDSSVPDSYEAYEQKIFVEAGCDVGTVEQRIACLRTLPACTLVNLPTVAHQVVENGKYVETRELDLLRDADTSGIPVMFGTTASNAFALVEYPSNDVPFELEGVQEILGLSPTEALRILSTGLFPSPNTGNVTLDAYTIAQHIATDRAIRCSNQAFLYALATSNISNPSYYYEIPRTINDSPLPFIFGNLGQDTDTNPDPLDLDTAQLISSYFAGFVRSGQPNPDPEYLASRGYRTTLDVIDAFGAWEPVRGSSGPMHILDFPPESAPFRGLEQCEVFGLAIDNLLRGIAWARLRYGSDESQ